MCVDARRVEIVLALGDLADVLDEDQKDPLKVASAEGEMGQVVSCLENITSRVVYIPGNVRVGWDGT